MELRQLKHFTILAEELHFGRAAQRSFVTQPALSASIARLEADWDVRLFERDRTGVQLTPSGKLMLVRAKEIVSISESARAFSRSMASGKTGRIEIGFTGSLLFRGVGQMLARFRAHCPQVEVVMRELPSQAQIDQLRQSRLDTGIITSPVPPADMKGLLLIQEHFVACLPLQHPFARRNELDLALLRDEQFIMFGRGPSPVYHDNLMAMCASAGFTPAISQEAAQIFSMIGMVASGFGISLVPESVTKVGLPGVSYVRLKHGVTHPTAHLVWSARRVTPALASLIAFVGDHRRDDLAASV